MRLYLGSQHAVGIADAQSGAILAQFEMTNPSFVTRSADGQVLYVVSEDPDGPGTVHALRIAGDDLAPHGPPRSSGGAQPCHVSVHPCGHYLLVSNYGDGRLAVLPLDDDGKVGEPSCVVGHAGSGPRSDRQAGPHVHQAVTDPSNKWVLACDLGADEVVVYWLDTAKGILSRHASVDMGGGEGPRHLAFTADGRHAWVAAELGSAVIGCQWEPETGTLTPTTRVDTRCGTQTENYPGAILVSGNGVYVTNRGCDTVAIVDADSARLRGTYDSRGHWPRDAYLTDGKLFVANERSGLVQCFTVHASAAPVLLPEHTVPFPGVSSVLAAD